MKQSVVGIVKKDNRFLLGLRMPGGDVGNRWEFPGGKCETGETHRQALIREYDEELHITVSVGNFIGTKIFSDEHREFELFAYEVFISENDVLNSSVHTKLAWFSFAEMKTLDLVPSDSIFLPLLQTHYGIVTDHSATVL